eukprot:GHVR01099018.1.p2 GENE.GHVR01099018.1~~GHVR01099018.1.p2  ORF type:complete len:179 (-),score=51.02 GHVR01099018.1:199-735(-)
MMPHIPQLDYSAANPEQQAAHDEELRLRGRMTNMKRTLLHSPQALRIYGEWFTLRDELRPVLGDRAIWLFCHAICVASDSAVGIGFMRRALIEAGDNPDALVLDDTGTLLARVGTAIARNPKSIAADDWRALQALYPAKTLVDLIAFAGQMIATNVFTDAVETTIDPELAPYARQPPS